MTRTFYRFAFCASLAILMLPAPVLAGRGGGRGGFSGGGGGMQRGGGGGFSGGGGMQRGGGGGMQRGGAGSSGFAGAGAGGAGHSPSFSQPRNNSAGGASGRNPYANNANGASAAAGAGAANRNQNPNADAAAGVGYANRNQNPNAGAAAAGAGYANRNQNPNAGAAAAGVGYANRNQNPNAGAAAAGAGYANRNQNQLPNGGAGAAGAAIANNNNGISNAGAAAAGAGYANRNQYSNAGAAAAGAAYANRNNYNAYHPGMSYGYWNGNYGAAGLGAYAGMAMASPAYGYGGGGAYVNPYAGGGDGQVVAATGAPNYTQPIDPSAAPPDTAPPAVPSNSPIAQARQAFATGDYDSALQLTQQALGSMPNDVTLHEFLGLILFAQGKYEDAAAPLYAVLSVGPGWDWTTLISNYSDASVYTKQLRGLESFVKANPSSARAQFVLSYQYITQGQPDAAVKHLKAVVALQPDDAVSAELLSKLQPPTPGEPSATTPGIDPAQLDGVWTAKASPDATIKLTLTDDANFTWVYTPKDKDPTTIAGTFTLAGGVLTLNGSTPPGGPLAGQVALADAKHLSFKAIGAPASDPGLQFSR